MQTPAFKFQEVSVLTVETDGVFLPVAVYFDYALAWQHGITDSKGRRFNVVQCMLTSVVEEAHLNEHRTDGRPVEEETEPK